MYKIEKNIEIKPKESFAELIRQMEIGDSFVCPLAKRAGMVQQFMNVGYKCKTQKISDIEARVWRIE